MATSVAGASGFASEPPAALDFQVATEDTPTRGNAVGLLDRLLSRPPTKTGAVDALAVRGSLLLAVVGESYRQDTLRRVARLATNAKPYLDDLEKRPLKIAETEARSWFRAALIREPTNPADPRAIAVHASGVGLVAYLSRDDARRYADAIEAAEQKGFAALSCPAMLSGGGRGKSFGVVLAIASPDDILDDLNE